MYSSQTLQKKLGPHSHQQRPSGKPRLSTRPGCARYPQYTPPPPLLERCQRKLSREPELSLPPINNEVHLFLHAGVESGEALWKARTFSRGNEASYSPQTEVPVLAVWRATKGTHILPRQVISGLVGSWHLHCCPEGAPSSFGYQQQRLKGKPGLLQSPGSSEVMPFLPLLEQC